VSVPAPAVLGPVSSRIRWAALVAVAIGVVAVAISRPVEDALLSAVRWCAASGLLGILAFAALYCVTTVLALPAAILTMAAGWAWGTWWGTVIVQLVSLLADWIPFAIARRAGRPRVEAAYGEARAMRALDAAMRDDGFVLTALLRLSPIAPYNVMNYLFGLTPVSTRTYLLASLVGATPSCLLYAYAGTLVPQVTALRDGGVIDDPLILFFGLGAALLSIAVLTVTARRALRRFTA
jgi:uncharacterized membrane protein YdjX (TVP38/TMEM64 family)